MFENMKFGTSLKVKMLCMIIYCDIFKGKTPREGYHCPRLLCKNTKKKERSLLQFDDFVPAFKELALNLCFGTTCLVCCLSFRLCCKTCKICKTVKYLTRRYAVKNEDGRVMHS